MKLEVKPEMKQEQQTKNDSLKIESEPVKNEPTFPIQVEEESYDLQKELEAKFDELFGPLDD